MITEPPYSGGAGLIVAIRTETAACLGVAAKCVTLNFQAICLTQQHTKVPGEDDRHTESTRKAVKESLQRAERCLCASAETKQHPQLSKPAGSRNAVHPTRQHQESSKHREHNPRASSRLCNIARRVYRSSYCDEAPTLPGRFRRPQQAACQRRPGAGFSATPPIVWSTAFNEICRLPAVTIDKSMRLSDGYA